MNFQEAIPFLKGHCGSHMAAAKFLGISWVYYSNIRNGKANTPKRTENYIILKAKEAESAARERADA